MIKKKSDVYQRMFNEGISPTLIRAIRTLVADYEGASDLLWMWDSEQDPEERRKIIEDFVDIIADRFIYTYDKSSSAKIS